MGLMPCNCMCCRKHQEEIAEYHIFSEKNMERSKKLNELHQAAREYVFNLGHPSQAVHFDRLLEAVKKLEESKK